MTASIEEARAMLEKVMAERGLPIEQPKPSLEKLGVPEMPLETKGCSACGGTMYRTVDTDANGNPTNATSWVCSNTNCGAVE